MSKRMEFTLDLAQLVTFVHAKLSWQKISGGDLRRVTFDELTDPDAVKVALKQGQAFGWWTWMQTGGQLSCIVSDTLGNLADDGGKP